MQLAQHAASWLQNTKHHDPQDLYPYEQAEPTTEATDKTRNKQEKFWMTEHSGEMNSSMTKQQNQRREPLKSF